jgi:hypothetical protein
MNYVIPVAAHPFGRTTGSFNAFLPGFRHIAWRAQANLSNLLRSATPEQSSLAKLTCFDKATAWQTAMKQLDLPWQQGRLSSAGDSGVSGVSAYWLLDGAGTIVAKVYDVDELDALIADRLK